ncbi:hypothetical protein AWB77_01354 [Caballeronia fortuita]|uniref:Uncharacterized protein n=1 Tax=Caballeronia fortuita TaxID=1777138 RepID=A0A158A2V6_9BURK|nr:hypothetical protein AWB77_01354 [Caballeronia fortuita]
MNATSTRFSSVSGSVHSFAYPFNFCPEEAELCDQLLSCDSTRLYEPLRFALRGFCVGHLLAVGMSDLLHRHSNRQPQNFRRFNNL